MQKSGSGLFQIRHPSHGSPFLFSIPDSHIQYYFVSIIHTDFVDESYTILMESEQLNEMFV
jgi:hypothetical protein